MYQTNNLAEKSVIPVSWRRLGRLTMNLMTAAVLCFGLLMILSATNPAGMRLLVVRSGSMEPKVRTGSLVVVRQVGYYNVNDVITFRAPQLRELVTHRVVKISQTEQGVQFTTKGDANDSADSQTIPFRAIIGTVRFSIPILGYAFSFAQSPIGLMILIVVPAIFLLQSEGRKFIVSWNEFRRGKSFEKTTE